MSQRDHNVSQYWVMHGALHLLHTADSLYDDRHSINDDEPFERLELLNRVVEMLYWLKQGSETRVIASRSIQHLSMVLASTKKDFNPTTLAVMERMDSFKLYDLAKDTGSTFATGC